MIKEYPPRPIKIPTIPYISICECGHEEFEHEYTGVMLACMPPIPVMGKCEKCMCPKHSFDHSKKRIIRR